MIINLRGTSGSGKSTVVRRVMECYASPPMPQYRADRKRPIGYRLRRAGVRDLWVVGHYETPCGGCDTIIGLDTVYTEVRNADSADMDVLFEGLIVATGWRRTLGLFQEGRPAAVVYLDTPLEVCLASIEARRVARGDDRLLKPDNTLAQYRGGLTQQKRFQEHGMPVSRLSREDTLAYCLRAFGVQP